MALAIQVEDNWRDQVGRVDQQVAAYSEGQGIPLYPTLLLPPRVRVTSTTHRNRDGSSAGWCWCNMGGGGKVAWAHGLLHEPGGGGQRMRYWVVRILGSTYLVVRGSRLYEGYGRRGWLSAGTYPNMRSRMRHILCIHARQPRRRGLIASQGDPLPHPSICNADQLLVLGLGSTASKKCGPNTSVARRKGKLPLSRLFLGSVLMAKRGY